MAPTVQADKHILSQLEPPPYQENDLTTKENPEQLLKTLMSCVKAGQRYRAQYSTNWTDYTRKMVGDFYRNKQRFGFECRPNKYLEKVELQANLLTQEPFKDYVVRADQSNDPNDAKPEVFTRIIADIKTTCSYNDKEYEMLLLAGMYGPGIFKVFWNRDLKDGRGYPDVVEIDPQHFIVSPGCKDIDYSQYSCYYRPVATSELKRLYPSLKDKIKEDPGLSTNDLYGQDVVENAGYAVSDSTTGAVAYLNQLKQREGTGRPGDQSMLHEFYYKDPRWITLGNEKELRDWVYARPGFGNPYFMDKKIKDMRYSVISTKEGTQVPLYPHGRLLFFINGVMLEDHPNPYRRFPFRVWKNHIQPHVFWPKGQIELISEPMSNYHVVRSSLSANWVHRAIPPWTTDDQTMDDNKFKKVQPGSLLKRKAGSTIEALAVPPIPVGEGQAILQLSEQEADGVSGVSNLLGGSRPQGVFAGSYFNSLQDSAFKVFGTLVKRLNSFRLGVGEDFKWMIQNLLTDERIIPFVNEDDQQGMMTVNKLQVDSSGPTLNVTKQNNLGVGDFQYMCEEGTAQPYNLISRTQQANEVGKLMITSGYEMPGYALILQASGLPGWKSILRSLQQQYQMKMQMGAQNIQKQDALTAQQRLDGLRVEMAKLDAKIKAAEIQAQSSAKTAADSPETDPQEVGQIFQATVARMLQEGVAPEEIMAMVHQVGTLAGAQAMMPPQPQPGAQAPTQGQPPIAQDQNLDPQTPRIPLDAGAPPIFTPPPMPQPG